MRLNRSHRLPVAGGQGEQTSPGWGGVVEKDEESDQIPRGEGSG